MIFPRIRKNLEEKELSEEVSYNPSILIVEDDVDQLDLFVSFVVSEFKSLLENDATTSEQRDKLRHFNILKVSEMKSLEQAVISNNNVILALLDCNVPDVKGATAHDQFVKKDKHIITGQHRSVDLVATHLPGTPITLTSSMGRFQKTIIRYYNHEDDLKLEFISKGDGAGIQANIKYHLQRYVAV